MDNLIFSANVVLPLLLLMAVGFFVRKIGVLDKKAVLVGNDLVFMVFLPVLIFNNIRSSSMDNISQLDFFAFIVISVLICFAVATVVVMAIEKDNPTRGTMIQGMVRSNYSLFGIPLITLLLPNEDLALAYILLAFVIPLFNISVIIILQYFGKEKASLKTVLIGVAKNPLIIGTVAGIIFLYTGIELPTFLNTAAYDLGDIASPFALFMLGAGFEFKSVGKYAKQLSITAVTKLVLVPAVMITIAVLLGFRGVELACIMLLFCSPTAVNSYPMAVKMGANGDLAAVVVVFTSALCIFTVFCAIFILKTLALF